MDTAGVRESESTTTDNKGFEGPNSVSVSFTVI